MATEPQRLEDERVETPAEFDYDRTVAVSDGVFAIALTLLVLTINAPNPHGDFIQKLDDVAPPVGAYALSFAVVSLLWLRHHQFFRDLTRLDGRVATLNLVYLGLVAFIPFPTNLLADQSTKTFSVVLYATTIGLTGMMAMAVRVHALRAGIVRGASLKVPLWRVAAAPVVFGVSIPIAFVSPAAAMWTWVSLLFVGMLDRD